tara:strand:+ start:1021 stop:1317 length:297 start_codon:yes stop_codon:yes gene_type:complete
MSLIDSKIKKAKESRVKLGDVVTFAAAEPFIKSTTSWGTVVEVVDRGLSGRYVLCGIRWFNKTPEIKGSMSYHYESELVRLDEKLSYDALKDSIVNCA